MHYNPKLGFKKQKSHIFPKEKRGHSEDPLRCGTSLGSQNDPWRALIHCKNSIFLINSAHGASWCPLGEHSATGLPITITLHPSNTKQYSFSLPLRASQSLSSPLRASQSLSDPLRTYHMVHSSGFRVISHMSVAILAQAIGFGSLCKCS